MAIKQFAQNKIKNWASQLGLEISRIPRDFQNQLRFESFGSFVDSQGRTHPLLKGYRSHIKKNWRLTWWPVRALYHSVYFHNVSHPANITLFLEEFKNAHTLTRPLSEILDMLKAVHGKHPGLFYPECNGKEISWDFPMYIRPSKEYIAENIRNYASVSGNVIHRLKQYDFSIEGKKCLEIGCGTGINGLFISSQGASKVLGLDLDLQMANDPVRQDVESILKKTRPETTVEVHQGDITVWEGDDAFDLIFSVSVLEHLSDVLKSFKAMYRLLKPGGFMFHPFNPWFGPNGGHAHNTFDFPWGHVLLSRNDIEKYMADWRPHEKELALSSYDQEFTQPRLSLSEIEDLALQAGFQVLDWKEKRMNSHIGFLTGDVLEAAKKQSPNVSVRDLLVYDAHLLLRKPH